MNIPFYEKNGISIYLSIDAKEAWLMVEDFEEIKLFPPEDRSFEEDEFNNMLKAAEDLIWNLNTKLSDETKMELVCEFIETYGEHSETKVIHEDEISDYLDHNGDVLEEYEDEVFKVGEFWIYDRA